MTTVTYRNVLDGQVHVLLDLLTDEEAEVVARNARRTGFKEVEVTGCNTPFR